MADRFTPAKTTKKKCFAWKGPYQGRPSTKANGQLKVLKLEPGGLLEDYDLQKVQFLQVPLV